MLVQLYQPSDGGLSRITVWRDTVAIQLYQPSGGAYLTPLISGRASVLTEASGKPSHYQENINGLVSSHCSLSVC